MRIGESYEAFFHEHGVDGERDHPRDVVDSLSAAVCPLLRPGKAPMDVEFDSDDESALDDGYDDDGYYGDMPYMLNDGDDDDDEEAEDEDEE